ERRSLGATIAGELGSLDALDGFVRREGRPDVHFRGVGRVAIVSSDSTIGVAIAPAVFALCAKARVTVKDRDDALVTAFAATLAEERPEFGDALETEVWRGDDAAQQYRLVRADTVVAYGRDETLTRIRATLDPGVRFVPYGHRTSVGYVSREALDDPAEARAVARAAALDALLYDGDGCLSLHALFVERGGATGARDFAKLVAAACDDVAVEFPAGYVERDAPLVAYLRDALFRAAQGEGFVAAGMSGPHVVVLDPPREEPPPFLRRTLALYSVDDPAEAARMLRTHALPLEAVALSGGARADIERFALESGAARVADLGRLQDPPLGGEHGGQGRILPVVRAIYRG
ncbi:MAG: hypothetical protein IAI48_08670, partial [Candidatus Eremiobacteraeota bacterium]|nr:hypothetical protein [Candidatus Eremiobacteraeota bacterium]